MNLPSLWGEVEKVEKLKLLIITRDFSNRASQGWNFLLDELATLTDLRVWHEPGNINEILAKVGKQPDFILIHEHGAKAPVITGLSTLSIPFGVYMHDLHEKKRGIRRALHRDRVRYIFSISRDNFKKWFPRYRYRVKWLPHQVNPKIFRDYELSKDIDMLMIGNAHNYSYPLRWKIINTMKKYRNFKYHIFQGFKNVKWSERSKRFVGEKYAREINRAKIFFTCGSKYQYTVKKYFEVLACKTLLLAPNSKELRDLGFIPGVHFVAINRKNFRQKANYYLKNEEERKKITEQGYQMVHEKHTTAIRARQLLEMIRFILENKQVAPLWRPARKRRKVRTKGRRSKPIRRKISKAKVVRRKRVKRK